MIISESFLFKAGLLVSPIQDFNQVKTKVTQSHHQDLLPKSLFAQFYFSVGIAGKLSSKR